MPYRKHWSQANDRNHVNGHSARERNDAAGALTSGKAVSGTRERQERPPQEMYVMTGKAAEILCLSPRTLERMRVEGTGPKYFKPGGGLRSRVLYKVADLYEWLETQSYRSTSEYSK